MLLLLLLLLLFRMTNSQRHSCAGFRRPDGVGMMFARVLISCLGWGGFLGCIELKSGGDEDKKCARENANVVGAGQFVLRLIS